MVRLAVLASGSGTNAENIALHFLKSNLGRVELIITDNPAAGVIERAKRLGIPFSVFEKKEFMSGDTILEKVSLFNIDFIVLAGFLLLVPGKIIEAFQGRIINIHPALLPLHGGKGFYGNRVHNSVIASGSIISGITIHYVDQKFDNGEVIFQAACHVAKSDNAESLAVKIHSLEYRYYPVVIEKIISNL